MMLAYLMDCISPGYRWKQRLFDLIDRYRIGTQQMGFPTDYRERPLRRTGQRFETGCPKTAPSAMKTAPPINDLLAIMARLRDPEYDCSWDLKQNFRAILPHTLEEAYEVAEAIERGSMEDLCDELGDLLLQVVFHVQLAAEQGSFTFADVVRGIHDKMVRRHPHVFGGPAVADAQQIQADWERNKAAEQAAWR